LEVILVNDGNEDQTAAELDSLSAEFIDWVRVISLPSNNGPAAARNAGWEIARGRYVAFLDADDSWLPMKLERQLALMEAHPEIALTGHLAVHATFDSVLIPVSDRHDAGHTVLSRFQILLRNPMVTPSLMVRRSTNIRFEPSRRYMEDHRFIMDVVFAGAGVARLEETLAVIHKAAYGQGGLSGELLKMEAGELDNYWKLFSHRDIGLVTYIALVAYSLAKFCRRLIIVHLRRALGPA
jgi:glycosyltransferase involved in cell wall biosynthesis